MTAKQEKYYATLLSNIQKRHKLTGKFAQKDIQTVHKVLQKAQEHQCISLEIKSWMLRNTASAMKGNTTDMQLCQEKMMALYPSLQSVNDRIMIGRYIGIACRDSGKPLLSLEYLFKTKILADNNNDIIEASILCGLIASVLNETGNYNQAIRYCLEALRLSEKKWDERAVIIATGTISLSYRFLKNYPKAIQYQRQVVKLSRKHSHIWNIARSLSNLGQIYGELGDGIKAEYYFRKAIDIWVKTDAEMYKGATLHGLGITYLERSEYKKAVNTLKQAYGIAQKYGRTSSVIISLFSLARAYREQQQYDNALSLLSEAVVIADEADYPSPKAGVYLEFSRVYSEMENYKEALAYKQRAEKLEEELRNVSVLKEATATEVAETLYRLEKEQKELEERTRQAEEEAQYKEAQLQKVTITLNKSVNALKEVEVRVKPYLEQDDAQTKEFAHTIYKSLSKTIKAQHTQKPEKYFDKSNQDYIVRLHNTCATLTPMEIKVCILIKLNYSNKQISELLNVSELTVKTHRTRIRKKMSLTPRDNLLNVLLRI